MPDQAHKYETNYASSRTSNLLFVWEITLTCTKRLLKDMSDIFRNKHSSRSIYLTPKTTPRVTVWNTEDCCHICENEILPWRLRLIDANASQFTKWRSASQESKSIVNYVMLFLWAIIYGSYLSQWRCRQLAPQNPPNVHCDWDRFSPRLQNISELKAADLQRQSFICFTSKMISSGKYCV